MSRRTRNAFRPTILGVLAIATSMYGSIPGWGTFTRTFWLDGPRTGTVLLLACWFCLGLGAGHATSAVVRRASTIALYVGAVAGSLLAHAWLVPSPPESGVILGAITLGLTDLGEARRLGAVDPLWLRAAGASVLLATVALGVYAGYRFCGRAGSQGNGE